MMVNCFECDFCKRNGDKNPNIRQEACYCDCPDTVNKYDYSEYCRVSTWTICRYWSKKRTEMRKEAIDLEEIKARHEAAYKEGYFLRGTNDTYAVKGVNLITFHALAHGDINDLLTEIESLRTLIERLKEYEWMYNDLCK